MSEPEETDQDGIVIPITELAEDVLRAVIEAFVLREGTDYGTHEFSLDQKVAHVRAQLTRGEAEIVFHPASESVDIVAVHRGKPARRDG